MTEEEKLWKPESWQNTAWQTSELFSSNFTELPEKFERSSESYLKGFSRTLEVQKRLERSL